MRVVDLCFEISAFRKSECGGNNYPEVAIREIPTNLDRQIMEGFRTVDLWQRNIDFGYRAKGESHIANPRYVKSRRARKVGPQVTAEGHIRRRVKGGAKDR
jgi:hypothetical protein